MRALGIDSIGGPIIGGGKLAAETVVECETCKHKSFSAYF